MDAQHAIEAPRFLIGRDRPIPAASACRSRIAFRERMLEDLTARGHRFQKIGRKGEVRYGYAAAAVVESRASRCRAAPSRAVRTRR